MNGLSKVKLFVGALAGFSAMLVVACGGGGKADYPKIPTHPIYGDLPQLQAKWDAKNKALSDERAEKLAKAKNFEAGKKIDDNYKKQREQNDAQREKEIEAAMKKVKPMPFEMGENVGYEVKSVTISSPFGWDIDLEVTDKSKIHVDLFKVGRLRVNYLDADGNVIRENVEIYGLGGKENGDKETINLGFSDYSVSKIVFIR